MEKSNKVLEVERKRFSKEKGTESMWNMVWRRCGNISVFEPIQKISSTSAYIASRPEQGKYGKNTGGEYSVFQLSQHDLETMDTKQPLDFGRNTRPLI